MESAFDELMNMFALGLFFELNSWRTPVEWAALFELLSEWLPLQSLQNSLIIHDPLETRDITERWAHAMLSRNVYHVL